MADAVAHGDLSDGIRAGWSAASAPDGAIQRKCAECEEEEDEQIRRAPKETAAVAEADVATPEPASAQPERTPGEEAAAPEASQSDTAAPQATPGLLVDDESEAGGGQMRKAEFLRSLRAEVCAAVDGALSGTGRDSQGCPWIDHWLGYYEGRAASQLERSLRRYAPEAAGVATAQDYIPIVAARVRTSAENYAKTGEVAGLPDDMPDSPMPGGGVLGVVGGMFFKSRPGGARTADPVSVRSRLGTGQAMPSGVRSRMESAFGVGFGGVRLHTDSTAARLSDRLNARAFTIGEHVAFGGGEYQPDSLVGQALLAHELAHVVQQGRSTRMQRRARSAEERSEPLERDADTAAVRAVVSIATHARQGVAHVGEHALPRLKSGLRLQRCGRHDPVPKTTPEIEATQEALGEHAVSCMITANEGPKGKNSGVWYAQGYQTSYPNDWDSDYAAGYANPEYWEWIKPNQWRLKKKRSASAGVKAWLKGLTITECYATAIVSEVDAIRAAVGDAKFDELFGSEDKEVTPRLELGGEGSNALQGALQFVAPGADIGTIGNRPATVGEWHYFYNHPLYLAKHPAGVYQGENALLRSEKAPNGDQLWEGLGQKRVTERQMYANMMNDYNKARTKWDEEELDAIKQKHGGTLPDEYNPKNFPDKLTSYQQVLDAPPAKVDGKWRKGGYAPTARKALDPQKVKELRDTP